MSRWDDIWDARTLPPQEASTLAYLMAADGLDSGFAGMTEDAWASGVRQLCSAFGLRGSETVFEVGCGAGAFLYELHAGGHRVAGIDRSPALIAKATEVMAGGHFAVADAAELDPDPHFHAVVSVGVFLYFASEEYASRVIDLMVAKATGVVALCDLPDLATRAEDIARRQETAGGEEAYRERYAGLDHRYYDREWVAEALRERGLEGVRVEDQVFEGYGNTPFRFNAWGFVPR